MEIKISIKTNCKIVSLDDLCKSGLFKTKRGKSGNDKRGVFENAILKNELDYGFLKVHPNSRTRGMKVIVGNEKAKVYFGDKFKIIFSNKIYHYEQAPAKKSQS